MPEFESKAPAQEGALIEQAADIVSAYVSNNRVTAGELPGLIASLHAALQDLGKPATPPAEETPKATAAQIRRSITPDALISFVDGKPYKVLKRHLTTHGLTPAEYRQKFGLPGDYPMVAPSFTARRSEIAKSSGLGQRRPRAAAEKRASPDPKVTAPATPKRGPGRPRKAKAAE
ncbi:transcriptional regulator, MucR family [Methylobacterium sp. 4-46]|uniref:MucR family transcriptional regulator n=1 Tax=unclassified Methylobacterium TaxID=2615210 RepID=UPI000152DB59|nr:MULTISPECIES: MucR family transcriptional regulator [Methylobacterium]ACA15679.1 transcriptional regulator, MucR family [Methylobacterium sp. 4-46]WFT81391.1 MucR family transcriptional regulator [Methylobacterium nodulans]